ncbi:MAG: molybdenum cofactor guanylyltransferase [Cocleimonas sp.]|nr:molybdenum cofactor guanylyltransferase [Cocleimonas sp.]
MRIDKKNITAVILAGGKGRRLEGQDKGLVVYKGKALIQHVIERIHSQVGSIVINANRNQETYASYGYSTISDEMSDFQGPLAGFASAMKLVKTDYIITLPCDGPSLPLDLVSRMLSKLNDYTDPSNCIAVAHDGERMQPVHALIPVALITSLEAFLANGDRKIDLWYAKHELVLVDFSDQPDAFFNINKKEQLGEAHH